MNACVPIPESFFTRCEEVASTKHVPKGVQCWVLGGHSCGAQATPETRINVRKCRLREKTANKQKRTALEHGSSLFSHTDDLLELAAPSAPSAYTRRPVDTTNPIFQQDRLFSTSLHDCSVSIER